MRYAIISDIHGNTEALDAVLADIGKARVDRCICLGDIVGYGAEPVECIRKIKDLGIDTVMGNHDAAAVGETPLDYFNAYAKEAVIWTAEQIGEDEGKFINGLPLKRDYEGFVIVHSTLDRPDEWGYVMDMLSARSCFERMESPLCFIGHSHVPVVFREKGSITCFPAGETVLEDDARYIINVGSVGQPRDGDSRASYGIYDTDQRNVTIRRVPYDVGGAQEKIIDAGLPGFLALRLGMGR